MKIAVGAAVVFLAFSLGIAPPVSATDYGYGSAPPSPSEPTGGYIVVTAERAVVAAAPAEGAPVVETAASGDVFPFEGRLGPWYHVMLGGERRGWVHAGSVALFFYPEYLFSYQPPDDWTPPGSFWVPPPGWVAPPNWVRRPPGWYPPPRWRPNWWGIWFDRHDRRWDDRHHPWDDWDRGRGRGRDHDGDWDRGRDWDRDRDRDRDRGRDRDRDPIMRQPVDPR